MLAILGFVVLSLATWLLVSTLAEKISGVRKVPFAPLTTLWTMVREGGSPRKLFLHIATGNTINSSHHFPGVLLQNIYINDLNMAKAMFSNPVFNNRPSDDKWTMFAHGKYGMTISEGAVWEEQRKFAMVQFKQYGFGTKRLQDVIETEIEDVFTIFSKANGKLISPNDMFHIQTLNIMWKFLVGHRLTDEGPKIVETSLNHLKHTLAMFSFPQAIVWFTPISLKFLLKVNSYITIIPAMASAVKSIHEFLGPKAKQEIAKREKALENDPELPSSCFVDAYLLEMKKNEDKGKPSPSINKRDGINHLRAMVEDFFIIGGDTTALTLTWSMLHLIRNPDAQEKIVEEIAAVTGNTRLPHLEDRPNCPYTEAFMYEVLRVTPAGLNSIPHVVAEDAVVGGYSLKKGTTLNLNITAINNDKGIWGDPENFRPERYIVDGRCVRPEALATFSVGRRRCPGEQLAKDVAFLFIACLCQRFKFQRDPKLGRPPPLSSRHSVWNSPADFHMLVEERMGSFKSKSRFSA